MRITTTPNPLPQSPFLLKSVAYLFLLFTLWSIGQMTLAFWEDKQLFHSGIFSIFIYRGLLEQRLAWRNLALWVAVIGIAVYALGALGLLVNFLDPMPFAISNEVIAKHTTWRRVLVWLSHLSFPAYLWINYVLRRDDIRRLFAGTAKEPTGDSNANTG